METPTTTTTTTTASSPEFEFWQVRNPSSQQPTLHSADQLFSDGVLLPLRLLTTDDPPDTNHINITTTSPEININLNPPSVTQDPDKKPTFTASKRWKDIFKKNPESKETEKKKKKNSGGNSGAGGGSGGGGGVTGTAELNINLWPFSRSRSAGTSGSRQRTAAGGGRKVSSAPCSRSNSTGDKYRKWPTSPARPGVHLGRSSPVWQAKRVGQTRNLGPKSKVLNNVNVNNVKDNVNVNVNVPTCIGYRQRMSCNAGGKGGVTTVNGGGDGGGATAGLFNLRSLFTKKVF